MNRCLAKVVFMGFAAVMLAQTAALPGIPTGASLVVELRKAIDARKAKPGDEVRGEIVQDLIANGRVVVRRGSKLAGHITQASAHDASTFSLVLAFDRVKLRGGEELAVNAVVQALAAPVEQPDVLGSASSPYGGGSSGGSQPMPRGASRDTSPRDDINSKRAAALEGASNPGSYGSAGNTLNNGHLGPVNQGVFGLTGVVLKPAAGGSESEIIFSKDHWKLENGAQMVLKVTAGH